MAASGDSEGFVSTPLKNKGARTKDSYFPLSDDNAAELKETEAELNQTFYGSLVILEDEEIFLGVNPPEVRLQLVIPTLS